jgi:hypothetical protein
MSLFDRLADSAPAELVPHQSSSAVAVRNPAPLGAEKLLLARSRRLRWPGGEQHDLASLATPADFAQRPFASRYASADPHDERPITSRAHDERADSNGNFYDTSMASTAVARNEILPKKLRAARFRCTHTELCCNL